MGASLFAQGCSEALAGLQDALPAIMAILQFAGAAASVDANNPDSLDGLEGAAMGLGNGLKATGQKLEASRVRRVSESRTGIRDTEAAIDKNKADTATYEGAIDRNNARLAELRKDPEKNAEMIAKIEADNERYAGFVAANNEALPGLESDLAGFRDTYDSSLTTSERTELDRLAAERARNSELAQLRAQEKDSPVGTGSSGTPVDESRRLGQPGGAVQAIADQGGS